MLQGKNLTNRINQTTRIANDPSPLYFDPHRAVAGIAFHLIDEGITRIVAEESVQRTVNRLRHESFVLAIPARTWAAMSNADRLRRLLDETATEAALLPDDTVILTHRRKRAKKNC